MRICENDGTGATACNLMQFDLVTNGRIKWQTQQVDQVCFHHQLQASFLAGVLQWCFCPLLVKAKQSNSKWIKGHQAPSESKGYKYTHPHISQFTMPSSKEHKPWFHGSVNYCEIFWIISYPWPLGKIRKALPLKKWGWRQSGIHSTAKVTRIPSLLSLELPCWHKVSISKQTSTTFVCICSQKSKRSKVWNSSHIPVDNQHCWFLSSSPSSAPMSNINNFSKLDYQCSLRKNKRRSPIS